MADLINSTDKQQGRRMAWHGKTEIRPDLSVDNNWLGEWDILETPLFTADGKPLIASRSTDADGNEVVKPWSILTCTDDSNILIGQPFNPDTFRPVSNAEFLRIIREAIGGTGYTVESVLSCADRGVIALSISLEVLKSYRIGERDFESCLNFGVGHDKSCVFYTNTSNICTVCYNTHKMNLSHKGKLVNARVKQTKNSRLELANLPEIIDAAVGVQAQFAATMQTFLEVPCKHSEAKAFFTGSLVNATPEEISAPDFEVSTRTLNRVDRMLELFHDDTKGNHGKNRADLFSAVTDYYSHESAGGADKWKQFVSSEMGSAAKEKSRFWDILNNPAETAETFKRGEMVLAVS